MLSHSSPFCFWGFPLAGLQKFTCTGAKKKGGTTGEVGLEMKVTDNVGFEVAVNDTGDVSTKTEVSNLAPGLKVAAESAYATPDSGKLEMEYSRSPGAIKTEVEGIPGQTAVNCSAGVEHKGALVAAKAAYKVGKGLDTYGVGAQYTHSSTTVSASAAEKLNKVEVRVKQNVGSDTSIVGEAARKMAEGSNELALGASSKIDSNLAKCKVTSKGVLSLLYSMRIDKSSSVTLCSEVNVSKPVDQPKLGVQLDFQQ